MECLGKESLRISKTELTCSSFFILSLFDWFLQSIQCPPNQLPFVVLLSLLNRLFFISHIRHIPSPKINYSFLQVAVSLQTRFPQLHCFFFPSKGVHLVILLQTLKPLLLQLFYPELLASFLDFFVLLSFLYSFLEFNEPMKQLPCFFLVIQLLSILHELNALLPVKQILLLQLCCLLSLFLL